MVRAEEEWIEQSKPGACSTWRGRSSRPAGFQPFSHTCVPTGYSFLFGTFCAPTSCTVNFVARLLQAEALALSSHRKSQERGMGVQPDVGVGSRARNSRHHAPSWSLA